MRRFWMLICASLLVAAVGAAACGDDGDDEKKDGSVKVDLGPPDAGSDKGQDMPKQADLKPDTTVSAGNMGQGCTKSSDCTGAADRCLTMSSSKGAAVCSKYCKIDDPKTPLLNEDDCPKGFRCAAIKMNDGSTKNYCFQDCTPSFTSNPCPASSKLTCSPSSVRYGAPGQAVCFYTACTSNKDCPVWSDKKCAIDMECSSLGTDAFCSDNYCARPGKCTAGGICGVHTGLGKKTAKVGDPCKSDFDCMENGRCIRESKTYTGAIGTSFNNGYCVVRYCSWPTALKEFACPSGSACNILYYGGYCFKSCNPAKAEHCRNNANDKGGDYECYDWSTWTYKGQKIVKEPICQDASTRTCASVNSTNACAAIAPTNNPNKMRCRDRYTGKDKSNKKDPLGVCLDNTASGKFLTTVPDAGYPDVGAPDAGVKGG